MESVRKFLGIPTTGFNFEDFECHSYSHSEFEEAAVHSDEDESSASDSTIRPPASEHSDERASDDHLPVDGLNNLHRAHSSMTLPALARCRAPKRRRPVSKDEPKEEDSELRELRMKRKREKEFLSNMRKETKATVQLYDTCEWYSPGLERLLANDPTDPVIAVAQAQEKNAILSRRLLDDVEQCADHLLAQIQDVGSDYVQHKLQKYLELPLTERTIKLMDLLEVAHERRFSVERKKIRERIRIEAQTARQDSISK